MEVSPSRRYLVMYPVTHCGAPIEVLDLLTLELVLERELDPPAGTVEVAWQGETHVRLRLERDDEPAFWVSVAWE